VSFNLTIINVESSEKSISLTKEGNISLGTEISSASSIQITSDTPSTLDTFSLSLATSLFSIPSTINIAKDPQSNSSFIIF